MQEIFNINGYFSIQVTPLGENLCLLEDRTKEEIKALVEDGKAWLNQWFKDVRP